MSSVQFVSVVREFIKERADIEKEYAKRLEGLCKKYSPKKKDEKQIQISTKDGWEQLMVECLQASQIHSNFGDSLSQFANEQLKKLWSKREESSKKHMQFIQKFLEEGKKVVDRVEDSRRKYLVQCDNLSLAKGRYERAVDEKTKEKCRQVWHQEILDMNNAKNLYLLSIKTANAMKHRYVNVDAPDIRQSVQEFSSSLNQSLIHTWTCLSEAQLKLNQSIIKCTQKTLGVMDQLDPTLDCLPIVSGDPVVVGPDVAFVSCGLWKEKDDIVTDEFSTIFLHNRLIKLYNQRKSMLRNKEILIKGYSGLKALYEAYQKNPLHGDADDVYDVIPLI